LGGIFLWWKQLVVGVVDDLLGLFDLEVIGIGFDEGEHELMIDLWLRLGGYEFVEGKGVEVGEIEGTSGFLEVYLYSCEETEVIFEDF
jgi:hypothetical protein